MSGAGVRRSWRTITGSGCRDAPSQAFPSAARAPTPLNAPERECEADAAQPVRPDEQRLLIAVAALTVVGEQQVDHHKGEENLCAERQEEEEEPVKQHTRGKLEDDSESYGAAK